MSKNSQDFPTASGKLLPNANGNLSPAQQIIYIYGPRQLKMQDGINLIEKAGSDYLMTPGIGAHKLHFRKLSWNKARRICIEEGGKFLTVILFDDSLSSSNCSVIFYHLLWPIMFQREFYFLNFLLYEEYIKTEKQNYVTLSD